MTDQAEPLREIVREVGRRARVVAVSSGKGGVGKTSTSVNLAIALSQQGNRVIVIDADLGLANVEVLLGLNSLYNLQHVIDGEKKMANILVQGPGGIEVVPGSSGIAKLADLGPRARRNIIEGMDALQYEADFIIVDTMAGIGQNTVAFCAAADETLLVTTPEPSAIVDAYAMIKTITLNREDAVVRTIINMTASEAQARAVANKINRVAQRYLNRQIACMGYVLRDIAVSQAVMQSNPFIMRFPACQASKCIQALATRLVNQRPIATPESPSFLKRFAQTIGLAS